MVEADILFNSIRIGKHQKGIHLPERLEIYRARRLIPPAPPEHGGAKPAKVAQSVEHATENRSVGGSIPPLGTKRRCR